MESGVVIMGAVPCIAREAYKLIDHIDKDSVVILTAIIKIGYKKYLHNIPEK